VTSASGPIAQGPTWGVVANDLITGITPSLSVTDVKSISINRKILLLLFNLILNLNE
jgi:hypothetical protein